MYADVVIPSYKGPNADSFTYEIPQGLDIKVGQMVEVPFGRNNERGLIIGIGSHKPETETPIKQIQSILFEKPVVLPRQIELLDLMSKYYLASKGNCANVMLPEVPGRTIQGSTLPEYPQGRTFTTIVLVPSINRIAETMAGFPQATNPVIYHNQLKPSEKFQAWIKILSGNCDFVFGSRSAIFAPCPKLKLIVIFDEHDGAFKDERSPYFDTLTIAEMLQKQTKAKIQIFDNCPKITTVFTHKKDLHISVGSQPKTHLVSMVEEKLAGNKTPISDLLAQTLKNSVAKNQKVLLFLNKKNESGSLFCKACKRQQRMAKEPEICPNCGSNQFWFFSLNLKTLANLVKKTVPQSQTSTISNSLKSNIQNPTSNIDIATAAVFYRLHFKKYTTVAIINADSALMAPDFNTEEKTYFQITALKNLSNKTFIVQTYNAENETIKAAIEGNYVSFVKNQLVQRQALSYPPYSALIKISLKGKNQERLLAKAERLAFLLKTAPQTPAPIVLGPFAPFFQTKSLRYNIVLKILTQQFDLDSRQKTIGSTKDILKSAKDAQIIVDPESLN